MSLIKKIYRNLMGLAHDGVDAVSDAGRDARQILREYEAQIAEAESSLIDVKATYEVLNSKLSEANKEVTKWTDYAKLAVGKGDDATATDCLERKRRAATQVELLQSQIDVIKPQADQLQARIDELRAEANNMSSEVDVIQARHDISKASQKASSTISGIGNKNLQGEFKSIRDRVIKDEAKAKVMAQLAEEVSGASLEKRVATLSTATSVQDELAALKAEVKK